MSSAATQAEGGHSSVCNRRRLHQLSRVLLFLIFTLTTLSTLACLHRLHCATQSFQLRDVTPLRPDELDPAGTSTERASEIDERTTTRSSGKSRTCLVLRDVSSMETDAGEREVHSLAGCADDVDVLDVIETCYGLRPILLSKRFIDRRSNASECFTVPNVVHYIMLRPDNADLDQDATFLQYVSFLGVHQHIRPSHIIVHGNVLPRGAWWRRTANDVANIYFVNVTDVPTQIYGKPLKLIEHRTDVLRYRILYEFGGIYLDPDVLVLRSFDPLRRMPLTLACESVQPIVTIANGIIVCGRGAVFIRLWLETYRTFDPDVWSYHSTHIPARLLELFPALAHVEDKTLVHPHWTELDLLFGKWTYDWSGQYSCHVWRRLALPGSVPESPNDIAMLNSTLGQMMRHIYNGPR